jgi:sodium/bile acid cotransporter 7
VMALPLKFGDLWNTIRRPFAPALAILISYGLAPLAATLIAPFLGKEFEPGFLVAAALPCTMASAAVWTRRAGGNDAIALCVTAVTNFFCFLVFPALFALMFDATKEALNIDLTELSRDLLVLVVVPIILGQLLRIIPVVASFSDHHRQSMSNFTQCGVLLQVLLGAIVMGNRWQTGGGHWTPAEFALMVASVTALHLFLFAVGYSLSQLLQFSRRDSIAVGFSGSQKTLMVGLQVAAVGGYSILPLICYHVLQLFYDTIIAERFRQAAAEEPERPIDKQQAADERRQRRHLRQSERSQKKPRGDRET